jgi:hypothetical protein
MAEIAGAFQVPPADGEAVTVGELVDVLRKDNPDARTADLVVFADALKLYAEAAANVRALGAVVGHPRTGAPLENPYLKVLGSQGAIIGRMGWIVSENASAKLAPVGRGPGLQLSAASAAGGEDDE